MASQRSYSHFLHVQRFICYNYSDGCFLSTTACRIANVLTRIIFVDWTHNCLSGYWRLEIYPPRRAIFVRSLSTVSCMPRPVSRLRVTYCSGESHLCLSESGLCLQAAICMYVCMYVCMWSTCVYVQYI